MSKARDVAVVVAAASLAVIAVVGVLMALAPSEEGGVIRPFAVRERIAIDAGEDCYLHSGADLYVYSDRHSTQKFHVDGATGAVDAESTGNFLGAVTLQSDLSVDDTLNIDDTDSTLTGTQTLTPTASFYELNPASTLTLTLGATDVGDILVLQNISAQSVIIVDTGATVGGGNITLGTNDLAVFIYTNSKWVEIASPDNS